MDSEGSPTMNPEGSPPAPAQVGKMNPDGSPPALTIHALRLTAAGVNPSCLKVNVGLPHERDSCATVYRRLRSLDDDDVESLAVRAGAQGSKPRSYPGEYLDG